MTYAEKKLLHDFQKLNEEGREIAINTIRGLASLPNLTKPDSKTAKVLSFYGKCTKRPPDAGRDPAGPKH